MKNSPKNYEADKGGALGNKLGIYNVLMLVFLIFNLVIRFGTIFYYPPYNGAIAGLVGSVVASCVLVVCWPR